MRKYDRPAEQALSSVRTGKPAWYEVDALDPLPKGRKAQAILADWKLRGGTVAGRSMLIWLDGRTEQRWVLSIPRHRTSPDIVHESSGTAKTDLWALRMAIKALIHRATYDPFLAETLEGIRL